MNLSWIDDFVSQIKDKIFLREEDRSLIIPPNQVYSLNESALKILKFMFSGGRVEEIIERTSNPEAAKDLQVFFRTLRDMITGQFVEELTPGVEYVSYRKEFYTFPVLSEYAVTFRCNLRCKFCYLDEKVSCDELSTRKAKKILRILKEKAKVPFVSFTGGEPLLRSDLEELIAHAISLGMKTNLITNGSLISRARAKSLADAGLSSAQVSLEAPDEKLHNYLTGENSFKATLKGIEYLMAEGIYVHTNTTLNRANARAMLDFPAFIKFLGLKKFSSNIMIPVGRAKKHLELYLSYREIGALIDSLRERASQEEVEFVWYSPLPYCIYNPVQKGVGAKNCAACHGLASVDPEGYLLPCSSYPRRVGNLLREEFEKIWFSKEALYFRKMEYLPEKCRCCSLKEMCAGACPLYWEAMGYEEIRER